MGIGVGANGLRVEVGVLVGLGDGVSVGFVVGDDVSVGIVVGVLARVMVGLRVTVGVRVTVSEIARADVGVGEIATVTLPVDVGSTPMIAPVVGVLLDVAVGAGVELAGSHRPGISPISIASKSRAAKTIG